jgi:hypothetical protein
MTTAKQALREKREAHHLWNAEKADGKIRIQRTKAEKEDWEENMEKASLPKMSSKVASTDKDAAKATAHSFWGLFGASLIDDPSLTNEIPKRIAQQFNACANMQEAPSVKTWDELRTAFGNELVQEAREAIAEGMRLRMASKELDLPLVVTADICNELPNVGRTHIRAMVDGIKAGKVAEVVRTYGEDGKKVAKLYNAAKKTGMYHIAIDSKAKKVIEDYFGPFGTELVREIRRKVRADLAERWLRKNGVDASAASYWSAYFGTYGEKWVSVVPALLRPKK